MFNVHVYACMWQQKFNHLKLYSEQMNYGFVFRAWIGSNMLQIDYKVWLKKSYIQIRFTFYKYFNELF